MPPSPDPNLPPPRPVPSPADFAARQEAERLLSRANIQFRRGLVADAETAVRQLLTLRPQDAGAHELMADILQSQGDMMGAQNALRDALAAEPGRPTAETKLARNALRLAERAQISQMGLAYSASGLNLSAATPRGHLWTIVATLFFPGLGQYLNGDIVKGIILGGVYFAGGLLLFNLPDVQNLLRQIVLPTRTHPIGPLTWFLLILLAADWLYAVIDIARTARPPAPPSDKDGWQV